MRFLTLILILVISLITIKCGDTGGSSDSYVTNVAHINRSNNGLAAWSIGLSQSQITTARSTDPAYVYSPANWMILTNSSCDGHGIPDSMKGASCPLVGATIGICSIRYSTGAGTEGQIYDTTLMMLNTFQDGSDTESEKQSVYTHEVGHCLGLKHTASLTNIMYSTTAGANTPSSGELAAIAEAYNPVAAPSAGTISSYYNSYGGNAVRHWTFPTFYIYPYGPNSMLDESALADQGKVAPGPVIGPYNEVVFHYQKNGNVIVKHYDNKGNLLKEEKHNHFFRKDK